MGKHLITATIYDKKGNILAKAKNDYTCTHPIQARFANSVGEPSRIFLHAEIAALVKLHHSAKPYKISITRYLKDGTPANAAPCKVCQAAIKHWKLSVVEYTI